MKLDVKELVFAPFGQKQSFSIELFNEQIDDELLAERIKGTLALTKIEDELLGKFEGSAKVKLTCDRCLSEYSVEIPLKFSQEYLLAKEGTDEEKLLVERNFKIDVLDPIRQEIITRIPTKKLCQTNCAGICAHCGKNLNESSCACGDKRSENSDKKE